MTDTKPTIDEQIAYQQEIIGELIAADNPVLYADDILMEQGVLASLEELKRIQSAEMPVEPDCAKAMRMFAGKGNADAKEGVEYIDALKAYAQRKDAEATTWEKEAKFQRDKCWTYIERAESLEQEKAALIAEVEGLRRDAESEQRWATHYAQKMHESNVALQNLEQAYSNKHSPQHRESCLIEARAVLAAIDNAIAGEGVMKELPSVNGGSPDDVVGHKTFIEAGGVFRHEPLTRGEADTWIEKWDADEKLRNELMPDEKTAIEMLFNAHRRLKDFGWNDACYCPKDGSEFLALEAGSTGQHVCVYRGEWPKGNYWIQDPELGPSPSNPVLYKPIKEAR